MCEILSARTDKKNRYKLPSTECPKSTIIQIKSHEEITSKKKRVKKGGTLFVFNQRPGSRDGIDLSKEALTQLAEIKVYFRLNFIVSR